MTLKERLTNLLGGIGYILYIVIFFLLPFFPIAMINISFDLPWWVTFIETALLFVASKFFSCCFWIIGLIAVITGPQDIIAIIYYILFVIIFAPTIISLVAALIGKTE